MNAATTPLTVKLGPLTLRNPVLVASGTFGYGHEYAELLDLRELGGVVVKGTTLEPRAGNSGRRLHETPSGLLNSIGLANPGVDAVIAHELPFLHELGVPAIVNIAGHTQEEYGEVAARLDGVPGVAALEVNISCPNVKAGGMAFGTIPETARSVTEAVRRATRLPIFVKLSPNVTDAVAIARAVADGGADGLSLINTLLGLAIDVDNRRAVFDNEVAGLSGPCIRPVAVRMVWQVAAAVDLPIIGMGGIEDARDALEFVMAGASAVQVGTALFHDPLAPLGVVRGLEEYCRTHGVTEFGSLTGIARQGRG